MVNLFWLFSYWHIPENFFLFSLCWLLSRSTAQLWSWDFPLLLSYEVTFLFLLKVIPVFWFSCPPLSWFSPLFWWTTSSRFHQDINPVELQKRKMMIEFNTFFSGVTVLQLDWLTSTPVKVCIWDLSSPPFGVLSTSFPCWLTCFLFLFFHGFISFWWSLSSGDSLRKRLSGK